MIRKLEQYVHYSVLDMLVSIISPPPTQALGGVLIGVGAWLQVEEEDVTAAVDSEDFLIGPYLIIAAGCCIVVVAIIGVLGALCDKKINRFLLIFVSYI